MRFTGLSALNLTTEYPQDPAYLCLKGTRCLNYTSSETLWNDNANHGQHICTEDAIPGDNLPLFRTKIKSGK